MHMIFSTRHGRAGWVSVLILGITYAIVGRLALLLAIPPGYATAIFPSAGIALAALLIWGNRLWPGVFLGSVLLNIWVSLEQASLTLVALEVSVGAATGATAQALAGAWLVRKVVGYPTTLSKEQDIFWFMLMAGPLACVINASVGATSLLASGVIDHTEYAYSWFTWWVGDAIGVLITAPLMFICFSRPRSLWWGRRNSVAVPLVLSLAVVIALFVWVSKWEFERTELAFRRTASETADSLRASFQSHLDSVASIERFFVSSSQVARAEFRSFVENMLVEKPGIQGLGWNPVVSHRERDSFERAVRASGLPDFQITERDADAQLVSAQPRAEYVVATYLEPMHGNAKALGYDVASSAERREALDKARTSGKPVATARITLVQESGEQAGFLLFHPVYERTSGAGTPRSQTLRGFAVGVFRVGDIVDAVLRSRLQDQIVLGIYDATASGENAHLYGPEDRLHDYGASLQWTDTLDIGGQRWILHVWPAPSYLAGQHAWQAWTVMAAGLIFASVLGAFLLSMTGRAFQVETLVARRTAELSGILENAIDAIITLGEHGLVESINPAGEALFGYSASELTGQPVTRIIPDFFANLGVRADGVKSLSVAGSRSDSFAIRKDKTRVPVEVAISSLLTAGRTIYTAIIHDLTERDKVNRMKDEFISTVNHELRTPLTSIKGALGLVMGGVLDDFPDKKMSALVVSYENSERLEKLINDLLDINKIQSEEDMFKMQPVGINALITKSMEANQGYANKYGIACVWSPNEASDAVINGDENRLVQVLTNLLSNAIKYSPAGSQVIVSMSRNDTSVRVSVADRGCGIPLEFQPRVFERFTQADSSDTRRVGGTGLGLAIARAIIEKHGGQLGFDSTPQRGSAFYLDLPIVTSTEPVVS